MKNIPIKIFLVTFILPIIFSCGFAGQVMADGLVVSCQSTPSNSIQNPISLNASVTFTSTVSGGTGSYTYDWFGACIGTQANCQNSFTSAGDYGAYLTVSSDNDSQTTVCSAYVRQTVINHDHRACYNDDAYWFDSNNVRNDLYQDCTYNQTCQSGNCVTTTVNHDHRACYNDDAYWFDSNNARNDLYQDCTSGQTCQSGSCVNSINYTDHRGCYNNNAYWFDNYGVRQALIQTCLYNQTCLVGYCVTNIIPAPANYRGCYNNDIYWYNGSTNVRLNLYRSCSDNNTCTFDSCVGSTCTNLLKCDGTTCLKGSADYVSKCTVCGDGVCDQGETLQSCSQDCNVIGLAVTIFGKRESDPVQWAKSFSADTNQNLDFLLVVSNGLDTTMNNVSVRADVPSELLYRGGLKIDGSDYSGDIRSGISLGSLAPKSTRTLTFKSQVADNSSIFGNEADTLATVTTSAGSSQDTTRVMLNKIFATNNNTNNTVFVPQQGLAGILGINLSNPLYLFLIIIIIILVLLGIARMIQGFRRD